MSRLERSHGGSTVQGRTVDGRVLLFENRVDDHGVTVSFAFRGGAEVAPVLATEQPPYAASPRIDHHHSEAPRKVRGVRH